MKRNWGAAKALVVIDLSCFLMLNEDMSDTKVLQMVLDKVTKLDQKVDKGFKEVKENLRKTDEKLTRRIGKLGYQLAELSDDAPTNEEFDNLEKRVGKLEKVVASN